MAQRTLGPAQFRCNFATLPQHWLVTEAKGRRNPLVLLSPPMKKILLFLVLTYRAGAQSPEPDAIAPPPVQANEDSFREAKQPPRARNLPPEDYIAHLANVAGLRATQSGTTVAVSGYYTPNDGGGGVFVWNSSSTETDNAGSIIQPSGVNNGRWLLRALGYVSVKQFGAFGNGTNNDAAAIQAAINTFNRVYFPTGDYLVGSATIIVNKVGETLYGNGESSVITGIGRATGIVEVTGESDPAYRAYAVIQDLKITGGGKTGLLISNVANATIRNVYIGAGFTTGISVVGAIDCDFYAVTSESNATAITFTQGKFSSCNLDQFYSCRFNSNSEASIYANGGGLLTFDGCDFEGNGTSAQTLPTIQFLGMSSTGVQPGAVFNHCWFETNHSAAAELRYAGVGINSGVSIHNCSFYSTDVKYNVQCSVGALDMVGNGINAVVSVSGGANVRCEKSTIGQCWNNWIGSTSLAIGSQVAIQDSNGHLSGPLQIGAAGKVQVYLDNSNNFTISGEGGYPHFFSTVSSPFTFNQGISITATTAGGVNAGALQVKGGAFVDGVSYLYRGIVVSAGQITAAGGATPVLGTGKPVTSGSGAREGTLTNAPTAGNPTKWIPFNDNGTIRYIPAW